MTPAELWQAAPTVRDPYLADQLRTDAVLTVLQETLPAGTEEGAPIQNPHGPAGYIVAPCPLHVGIYDSEAWARTSSGPAASVVGLSVTQAAVVLLRLVAEAVEACTTTAMGHSGASCTKCQRWSRRYLRPALAELAEADPNKK